jgi:DNA-binding PadR family transcriptional regulator
MRSRRASVLGSTSGSARLGHGLALRRRSAFSSGDWAISLAAGQPLCLTSRPCRYTFVTHISVAHACAKRGPVTRPTDAPRPESFLPLRPVEFQILLSLSQGERHGYGILLEAGHRMGEPVRWGVGTLYRAMRRLDQDDERRNYYGLTALGRAVVRAEAQRLDSLVRAARASGVLGGTGRQV